MRSSILRPSVSFDIHRENGRTSVLDASSILQSAQSALRSENERGGFAALLSPDARASHVPPQSMSRHVKFSPPNTANVGSVLFELENENSGARAMQPDQEHAHFAMAVSNQENVPPRSNVNSRLLVKATPSKYSEKSRETRSFFQHNSSDEHHDHALLPLASIGSLDEPLCSLQQSCEELRPADVLSTIGNESGSPIVNEKAAKLSTQLTVYGRTKRKRNK